MKIVNPCIACAAPIEFDAGQLGWIANCPGCGAEITLTKPKPPAAIPPPPPPPPAPAPAPAPAPPPPAGPGLLANFKTSPRDMVLGMLIGIPALLLLIGGIGYGISDLLSGGASSRASGAQSLLMDAHYTAEQFIRLQYPGAKSISSFRDSSVTQSGDLYTVTCTVDGLNAFGGPVRRQVTQQLRLNAGRWYSVQTPQQ